MEPVFSRFESYDFAADQRFQDGLKTLQDGADGDKLLDVKLFFYNRFVEPIDCSSYKQRTSASSQVTQVDYEQQNQRSLPDSDPGVSDNQTTESLTEMEMETETTQLSFAEVMRFVQEGKEVPGVKKLEVKPSNQSPTPSQMERILKPWEVS